MQIRLKLYYFTKNCYNMEIKKLSGLYTAVVTPMFENGDINFDAIDTYAQFLISRKLKGVFVNGSTGEGLLLDNDERKAVAEKWIRYADKLDILIHVGSTSYKLAADLASHAQSIGARAISAMGPCFMQPGNVNDLVAFNKKIAEAAPNTPYYYYHIPVRSGVNLNMVDFLKEAGEQIETFSGIKYTSNNIWEQMKCLSEQNGRFDILHGHDETLISGLTFGTKGSIGTSYNISSPIFYRLMDAFNAGDIKKAMEIQNYGNGLVDIMCGYGSTIAAIKAMIEYFDIPCGPARLPGKSLSVEQKAQIWEAMKAYPEIQ